MISLPTAFDKRLGEAAPDTETWKEAWGFLLLGVGLFLALACWSFSPYDYSGSGLSSHVSNLCGRWGAYAAAHVLGRFGVIGMLWPVVFLVWGALTATGFVLVPQPRRFLGLFLITADVAGFCEMLLPRSGLPEPSFGFGGVIGLMLRRFFMPQMGYGGTLVALAVFGVITLVLTGHMRVSRTADGLAICGFHLRRFGRKHLQRWLKFAWHVVWDRWIMNRVADEDDEDGGTTESAAIADAMRRAGLEVETPAPAKAKVVAPAMVEPASMLDLHYDGLPHGKPSVALFTRSKKAKSTGEDFKALGEMLTLQLAEFKIHGEVQDVTQGPVVTTYEFKPAPGTKVSKISALGEDLARLLKAQSLRVLAPIPGKDTVGFEVPNAERGLIGFADLIESPAFQDSRKKLPIALGVDIFGNPTVEDLAEMPHLLVAGSTGSGKSVFMNGLIASLIARHSARDLRFVMIDPKMVEMAAYNDLPHMACPVITDPQVDALKALRALVKEMDDRYARMRAVGARNIEGFNQIIRDRKRTEFINFEGKWATMPYVVLIIDELADMMMLLGKEVEAPIARLAQKARASGIHMVLATQRPSAEVVTGLIKANFPTRIAFRVMSGIDSRTILDQMGAETLLGKGDMLYLASGGARRMHGAYLSEAEVAAMVSASIAKKK